MNEMREITLFACGAGRVRPLVPGLPMFHAAAAHGSPRQTGNRGEGTDENRDGPEGKTKTKIKIHTIRCLFVLPNDRQSMCRGWMPGLAALVCGAQRQMLGLTRASSSSKSRKCAQKGRLAPLEAVTPFPRDPRETHETSAALRGMAMWVFILIFPSHFHHARRN